MNFQRKDAKGVKEKNRVAIETPSHKSLGTRPDALLKHLLFYSGDMIDVGVEILPVKAMTEDPNGGRLMFTGVAYYEGEVYNILRHGRNSPPDLYWSLVLVRNNSYL